MVRTLLAFVSLVLLVAPGFSQSPSPEDLARRTIERRAIQAVIWGMVEAWPMSLVGTPLYSGWTFEAPYEIVTGRWTIDVIRDGQLLARQGFDIVGPDEGCPAVQSQGGTFFDGSGKAMDNFRNILAGGFVQH